MSKWNCPWSCQLAPAELENVPACASCNSTLAIAIKGDEHSTSFQSLLIQASAHWVDDAGEYFIPVLVFATYLIFNWTNWERRGRRCKSHHNSSQNTFSSPLQHVTFLSFTLHPIFFSSGLMCSFDIFFLWKEWDRGNPIMFLSKLFMMCLCLAYHCGIQPHFVTFWNSCQEKE